MNEQQLMSKYAGATPSRRFDVSIKTVLSEKQIVTGEVYAPFVVDSHNEMMLPDDVELMAHRFLATLKNHQIDLMHDNKVVKATVVESFIARAGDPTYNEGAWVMSVKIENEKLWEAIKRGDYSGYSFEAWVTKQDAFIEITVEPHVFGLTEKNLSHDHAFFVKVDDYGKVIGGHTSPGDDGHVHKIIFGTATENADSPETHSHRFFLP